MLMIGTHKTIPEGVENIKIFNFSSFIEGYNKLDSLLPSTSNLRYQDEKQFDMDYANYLLSDRNLYDLFKIILPLYYAEEHVYLIVSNTEAYSVINESFIKFIQQRYGYNAHIINELTDFEALDNSSEFSLSGITNFDIDRNRYLALYGTDND